MKTKATRSIGFIKTTLFFLRRIGLHIQIGDDGIHTSSTPFFSNHHIINSKGAKTRRISKVPVRPPASKFFHRKTSVFSRRLPIVSKFFEKVYNVFV